MQRYRLLLLPFLLVFFAFALRAQPVPEDFLQQLEEFTSASGNKTAEEAFTNFYGLFLSGAFTEAEQAVIVANTNRLREANVKAQGGFVNYFHLLEQLKNATNGEEQFLKWHEVLGDLLDETNLRVDRVNSFLALSDNFISYRILDATRGDNDWIAAAGEVTWSYQDHPILKIEKLDRLVMATKKDSLVIEGTNIVVDLLAGQASGTGGRVDWQRVGLPPEVNADLLEYTFETTKNTYTASKAKMRYPEYFDQKEMLGTFIDKTSATGEKAGTVFPQFTSEDGYVEIKNVGKGIELAGNFEIRGSTIYAIGDADRRASVQLSIDDNGGQEKIRGRAERFSLKSQDKVSGESVQTTVYFGEDSLYHPSVTLNVDIQERLVKLTRTKSGSDRNPFYHSLNRVNIFADYLDVYLDKDSILIGKPTVSFADKGIVRVESEDFFSSVDYFRIQNIAEVNPLALLYALRSQEVGNDYISVERVAKRINPRFTGENIQTLLFDLVSDGFINYDYEKQRIRLKPKVEHYVRSERNQKDYDRIRISSESQDINGVINLKTGEISLVDIKPLEFNPKKRIAVRPKDNQLTIKGDRDFEFDGDVYAGWTVATGKEFHFKYQPYYIEMDSVKKLNFFIPDPNSDPDNPKAYSLASQIEDFSGVMLLDAPKNKSGKQDIDIFPSLRSRTPSFIYYDQGDTTSAYARDSFYFEVKPFHFNHLNSLTEDDMRFAGQLNSGNIFADKEEVVTVQKDGSLGFISEIEKEGVYGDRGEYAGQISLNNAGLQGKGTISYIGANVESEDIVFKLKTATASAKEFKLEEESGERTLPQVRGNDVNIDWRPYADSMLVRSTEDAPFDLYKSGDHTFDGSLALTPQGLQGTGELAWSAASMNSKAIEFGTFSATADTANVSIKSLESDDRLALSTTNVNASVDFEKQVAHFENNTNELSTTLPYNQFSTSIDAFDWDMAGNKVLFKADAGQLGQFTSTNQGQEGLTFNGTLATFDLNTSMLDIEGVDTVRSADAFIFPPDAKVRVEPGAKITEISNARIVADTVNQYHVINRATVRINGRRNYEASGFYEYNVGPHTQELELQEIVGSPYGKGKLADRPTATLAQGTIGDETTFYIDNKTLFRGTINLDATNKNLNFDGFAKIETDYLYRPQWFSVVSEGDKKDLTLKIDAPKAPDGYPLLTGFHLSKERRRVYPNFVQTPDAGKDHPILPIKGVFKYDEDKDRFLFGDSSRVVAGTTMGNIMVLDNRTGKVTGEGILGVGGRLTYVGVKSYGRISMNVPPAPLEVSFDEKEETKKEEPNNMMLLEEEEEKKEEGTQLTIEGSLPAAYPEVNVEMMAGVKLELPAKLLQLMTTDIKSASFSSNALNLVTDGEFYRDGIRNLFPESKERETALQGMALGYIDLPKKVNPYTILFSRLNVRWNEDYQSFVSTDKLTGVVSLDGESINKMLEVHVEFKMPSAGDDRFYIYLKSPSELFYFFGFVDGIMNVTSNNTVFMQEMEGMKGKDLVLKMPDGGTYEILPVELSTASAFLRRVQTAF